MSCSNETNSPLIVNNDILAASLTTRGTPKITSRLGEVKCLSIDTLAEINGYNKSNNGTTAGNTGGLVFKTRGVDGNMNVGMTLDGRGKLALGTHKGHTSALLTLQSATSGLLLPRLNTLDIKHPEPGLLAYDIEEDGLYVYKKSGWTRVC